MFNQKTLDHEPQSPLRSLVTARLQERSLSSPGMPGSLKASLLISALEKHPGKPLRTEEGTINDLLNSRCRCIEITSAHMQGIGLCNKKPEKTDKGGEIYFGPLFLYQSIDSWPSCFRVFGEAKFYRKGSMC